YHQQIYAVDVAIGMIRDAIREAGVQDNTVILFTSDNGFLCGSHGYGSKVLPYEEASRAPLIIFDPRNQNSRQQFRSSSLTGNVDIAPTVLDLAGLPAEEAVDGRSLLPIYNNPSSEIHSSLPLINVWGPAPCHSLAIVTKDLKYIYWAYDRGEFEPSEELYDTSNDPGELTNAATRHPDLGLMQELYDQQLTHWASKAVPYHNYRPFAKKFARRQPAPK
ncbi:MAG: sulfatase/phosphatase domain-containing protein, partial [Verrucomicrobiales bacterium]